VSIFAGLFLFVFGSLGAWLLGARFPNARFLRTGYVLMALGGLVFCVWALSHNLAAGIVGIALLLCGGISGAIGAFRKEVRMFPQ
jgi:hypothetical protein